MIGGSGRQGRRGRRGGLRTLLYSHDTFGLGHLRRSRTIAGAMVDAGVAEAALIVTGSPIAGRFDFPARVDHVRLPGVVKQPDGSYTASSLPLDIDEMVALRSDIILASARAFDPDLVIVDKEPWGCRQELASTLPHLKRRGARIVLGVRDVLDEEDALAREWERKGALEAIERFYDEIWVYGVPEICRPLAGLGLSARMEERCRIWFRDYVVDHVADAGRRMVHHHRQVGDEVAIVTSATRFAAEPLAEVLGIERIAYTPLEVDEAGRFTGRVDGRLCYGEGKIGYAERLLEGTGTSLDDAVFYSDSITDLPLLERVAEPVVVNPDARLRRLARRRGWRVERW